MTQQGGTGGESVERGAAEEASGSPLTETEIASSRRPASQGDDDTEVRDDASGTAGGSSGGTGGTSNMPGHPDAAR